METTLKKRRLTRTHVKGRHKNKASRILHFEASTQAFLTLDFDMASSSTTSFAERKRQLEMEERSNEKKRKPGEDGKDSTSSVVIKDLIEIESDQYFK